MAEQRYDAVRAVLADGETLTDVAARFGVARKTVQFTSLKTAQGALDEWVDYYNTARPHQSLAMATPADRFNRTDQHTSATG